MMADKHIESYTEAGESAGGVTCIRCDSHRVERLDVNLAGLLYECRDCWESFIV